MVDVLINCLLRNREILEELNASGIAPERIIEMPDGAFCDHPLSATANAMLNVGGAGGGGGAATEDDATTLAQSSNPVGLLCEYYKLPMEKGDKPGADKYSLPDFWSTMANGQTGLVGNVGNIGNIPSVLGGTSLSIVPQTELLRNRSDSSDVNPQEVEIYLNRGLIKRESPDKEELVPTGSVIKESDILKDCTTSKSIEDNVASDNPGSVVPILIQVKQEQRSPDLSDSPSPSTTVSNPSVSTVIAQTYSSHILPEGYETLAAQYSSTNPPQYQTQPTTSVYMVAAPPDYRGLPDYYTEQIRHNLASTVASTVPVYADASDTAAFVDRYIRQVGYKAGLHGLTVDLSSPDSGIGETTITPNRETANALTQVGEIFEYSELPQAQTIIQSEPTPSRPASSHSGSSRKSWQEYGRNSEADKIQIPKLHSDLGFRYYLESPISTSQRRDDDRITYINKGQFYGITLEYVTDPAKPLKSSTVKTIVMLMFREDKPHEEELKAWQFWHSRQHSVKQRILDADTKNNAGIVGQIEELSHNAVAFYWNPLEAPAKVNIAVQCLSTDFSNQKGVKGLPLHLQVDTFDDFRENAPPQHRGYCQIKVFCDKGAERKTRDEERRAAKRKLSSANVPAEGTVTFPGRKKTDEMFHLPCERSEFYSMSDLLKPPILFTPSDDVEKITSLDLSYYGSALEDPNITVSERRDTDSRGSSNFTPPPPKRIKLYPVDRVLLYARQQSEETYQPLHICPPTLAGLAKGIEKKYSINATNVRYFYKRNKKGITIQIDDDIVKYYCNEDSCIIEVTKVDDELSDITLVDV